MTNLPAERRGKPFYRLMHQYSQLQIQLVENQLQKRPRHRKSIGTFFTRRRGKRSSRQPHFSEPIPAPSMQLQHFNSRLISYLPHHAHSKDAELLESLVAVAFDSITYLSPSVSLHKHSLLRCRASTERPSVALTCIFDRLRASPCDMPSDSWIFILRVYHRYPATVKGRSSHELLVSAYNLPAP
jgi:hypothetical protein